MLGIHLPLSISELFPLTATQAVENLISDPRFEEFTHYENFDAVAALPEYAACEIIAIPKKFDEKPLAWGFQKVSAS